MTRCYRAPYPMPSADMGKENPLPDIKNISYIHAKIETTPAIPARHRTYINQGMIQTMLPYLQQDGYNRERAMKTYSSVVVENEFLKAVFLPELGGRLWSLVDKTENRELLDDVALYLLQKETITGDELMAYVNADKAKATEAETEAQTQTEA